LTSSPTPSPKGEGVGDEVNEKTQQVEITILLNNEYITLV
jgi:hypothetical protein